MTKQIFILLTSVIFGTCIQKERPAEANQINTGQPLYSNSVVRVFSNETHEDTLQVTLNGENLLTGQIYLRINNRAGKTIFWDSFPVTRLIDHQGLINPEKDKEHIYEPIDNFFDSDRFSNLDYALSKQKALADSTRLAWEAINLSDPEAVCFLYPVGKDDLKGIAYSKSMRRVISLESQ